LRGPSKEKPEEVRTITTKVKLNDQQIKPDDKVFVDEAFPLRDNSNQA
jgi:hypothetical protein